MTEMQITFENYKHLLVRIDQIDDGFRYKYYNEVQEQEITIDTQRHKIADLEEKLRRISEIANE